MKIMVGSKNSAKVAAVELGVHSYWPEAVVESMETDSGVSAQPIGLDETREGALNRARAAHAAGADLGVGLEGGVVEFGDEWIMMSFVAIYDGERAVAVPVTGTPLPHHWGEALRNGAELRPYVLEAGLPYDYKQGVIGLLTKGLLHRDEMFAMGVKTALAPWVLPEAYVVPETSAKKVA